jgi:hypothetical protein
MKTVRSIEVDKVVEKPLPELWKAVKGKAGVSCKEFNQYYEGLSVDSAIFFNRPLSKLRFISDFSTPSDKSPG